MIAKGRPVNPITIEPYIPAEQMVGDLTMFAYVTRLAAEAVTISGAYDYGRGIIEMSARHQLIAMAQDLDALARNMPVDMTPEKSSGRQRTGSPASRGRERARRIGAIWRPARRGDKGRQVER